MKRKKESLEIKIYCLQRKVTHLETLINLINDDFEEFKKENRLPHYILYPPYYIMDEKWHNDSIYGKGVINENQP